MRIGIIGAGKVGTAIGHVMRKNGLHIQAVSDIRQDSLDGARGYLGEECLYTHDNNEVVRMSEVIAVTTQDRQIKKVAEEIYANNIPIEGKLFFHTSGAHPSSLLKPLDERGAIVGSLHPLQTFPDVDRAIEVLPTTYVFIEGSASALKTLEFLGKTIGYRAVVIEGSQKVLYHLSAVFVCNLLCALLYSAEGVMDKVGIELEPFYPIINATLKNIEKKGPLMSLTGPVIRGDADTILDHLRAMSGMEAQRAIYKALSRVALDMAGKRGALDEVTMSAIQKVLDRVEEQ